MRTFERGVVLFFIFYFFNFNNLLHGAHRQAIADTLYLLKYVKGQKGKRKWNSIKFGCFLVKCLYH